MLPSLYQPKEKVVVTFTDRGLYGHITAVHFYPTKESGFYRVKYDIEIRIFEEESTRIYNLDEQYVGHFDQEQYDREIAEAH